MHSNGNIGFLNILLGENLDDAALKLANKGIITRKCQTLRNDKGVDLFLSGKSNLSFAKNVSIKIKTEFTGNRVIDFTFMWKVSISVFVYTFIEQFKMFVRENGLKYTKRKTEECDTYLCQSDLFNLWVDIPSNLNESLIFSVELNKFIQDQGTGEYNIKFIHELYLDYLKRLAVEEAKTKTEFNIKSLFKR